MIFYCMLSWSLEHWIMTTVLAVLVLLTRSVAPIMTHTTSQESLRPALTLRTIARHVRHAGACVAKMEAMLFSDIKYFA